MVDLWYNLRLLGFVENPFLSKTSGCLPIPSVPRLCANKTGGTDGDGKKLIYQKNDIPNTLRSISVEYKIGRHV